MLEPPRTFVQLGIALMAFTDSTPTSKGPGRPDGPQPLMFRCGVRSITKCMRTGATLRHPPLYSTPSHLAHDALILRPRVRYSCGCASPDATPVNQSTPPMLWILQETPTGAHLRLSARTKALIRAAVIDHSDRHACTSTKVWHTSRNAPVIRTMATQHTRGRRPSHRRCFSCLSPDPPLRCAASII